MSSSAGSSIGWAQPLEPPPDAGKDLQAILRWKYTEGWIPLSSLHNRHRRLRQYTTTQLEFAARHSRRHGSHRFSIRIQDGRMIIMLNHQHRRDHLLRQTNVHGRRTRERRRPPSETSTESEDGDRTTLPMDEVREDQESVSAWEEVPFASDSLLSSSSRGPHGTQGGALDGRISTHDSLRHTVENRVDVSQMRRGTHNAP